MITTLNNLLNNILTQPDRNEGLYCVPKDTIIRIDDTYTIKSVIFSSGIVTVRSTNNISFEYHSLGEKLHIAIYKLCE